MLLFLLACADPRPPNILLVTLDTTRWDAIGAYGQKLPTTPTLDALAAEGARFERAYTVTPLTIPAHSSLMTGMYPPRHGVRDNGDYTLGDDAVTLAETLTAQGYATGASVGAEVTSHHWGFAQGFGFFSDKLESGDEKNRWKVERPGNEVVDDALGWLAGRDEKQPWFLWVHLFDAHHPYAAPAEARATIPGRPYLAEVHFADQQVGRLVEAIKARGAWDNTWVVALADHGEGMGDHGEQMHGVLLYDATTRIPMIVRAPGAKAQVVPTPVSIVDLAPTLLAAAGAPAPTGIDGRDLGPVLRGSAGDATRQVYAESLYAWRHYGWSPQRVLVTDTHKLLDSTTPELYARADGPERTDIAAAEPDLLTRLRADLTTLYAGLTPSGAAQAAALDPERVAQLEALGYLASTGTHTDGELPTGLPDPVTNLPLLREVEAARQALQSGDVALARERLEAVLARDPGLADPQVTLAQVLMRQGDVEGALAVAHRLDAAHPSSAAKSLIGNIELHRGRPDAAVVALRAALESDPYLPQAWIPYLSALLAVSSPDFAAEAERGARLLPDVALLQGMAGVGRAMNGRGADARPQLEAAIAAEPTHPFLHFGLGLAEAQLGNVAAAEAAFDEETRIFPPAVPSRRELVKLLADQKRYDEQLAQLEAIRAVAPPDPLTLHSVAQAQFNAGRPAEAKVAVDECRGLFPEYPGCAMMEANVLDKLGRRDEAVAAYRLAMELAGRIPKEVPAAGGGAAAPGTAPGTAPPAAPAAPGTAAAPGAPAAP